MAEYINVKKPFLDKLRQLGWHVIDLGLGVPQEPAKSLREHFKQVLLPQVFKDSIKVINKMPNGTELLKQFEKLQLSCCQKQALP
jgi:type I restriction enzyme, R subunit